MFMRSLLCTLQNLKNRITFWVISEKLCQKHLNTCVGKIAVAAKVFKLSISPFNTIILSNDPIRCDKN